MQKKPHFLSFFCVFLKNFSKIIFFLEIIDLVKNICRERIKLL